MFYHFSREHWPHLRTTHVVESPFATVQLRATVAKRFKMECGGERACGRRLLPDG